MSIDTTKDISSVSYNGVNIPLASSGEWQPDADMKWAKSVCENDVQDGFTYKVLQMISDGYVYTDIVVPSGGAVKTSDGGYYTTDTKHIWNDTNSRVAQAPNNKGMKLRWLIYYYTSETPTISLLNDVMYACFDGVKFEKIFQNKKMLRYFDIINGANLKSTTTSLYSMFSGCYSLQSVPLFDTVNIQMMSYMFQSCYSLQTVPLFDTSNVTTMYSMFQDCYSLQTVPLFDTSNVTTMYYMFSGCYSLQSVPLFDTANVTAMGGMFQSCYSLQTVPLFDTSNVTAMGNMFYTCYSLQTVPLFDTSNVTGMSSMFSSCSSLQTVPLFDTSNVTSMYSMFQSCSYLEFIDLQNIGVSLNISSSTKYSQETLVNVIANLKDLTGLTAQTLTIGTTNLAKLTAEQIAVATAKNWSVA